MPAHLGRGACHILWGAVLRCAFSRTESGCDPIAPLGSDGEDEVIECHAEPVAAGDFSSDVVVAAPEILHEGMASGEDPG